MYNSQDMEATYMSIDRGMDKDVVNIYTGVLLSHKKEWNNATCGNMDEPRDCHTEWSKSDKDKYMISLICGIFKKGTNELIYKTEIKSQM